MSVLRQRYAGMKIVVGRDKLDEVQGVRHKIQAFERFLERYTEFQGKVCHPFSGASYAADSLCGLGGFDPGRSTNYGDQRISRRRRRCSGQG